jgi:hypothetical protein
VCLFYVRKGYNVEEEENDEVEIIWKEAAFRYYSYICPEGLSNTMKTLRITDLGVEKPRAFKVNPSSQMISCARVELKTNV